MNNCCVLRSGCALSKTQPVLRKITAAPSTMPALAQADPRMCRRSLPTQPLPHLPPRRPLWHQPHRMLQPHPLHSLASVGMRSRLWLEGDTEAVHTAHIHDALQVLAHQSCCLGPAQWQADWDAAWRPILQQGGFLLDLAGHRLPCAVYVAAHIYQEPFICQEALC